MYVSKSKSSHLQRQGEKEGRKNEVKEEREAEEQRERRGEETKQRNEVTERREKRGRKE